MKIAFITQNTEKIRSAKAALENRSIPFIVEGVSKSVEEKIDSNPLIIVHFALETPEIQSQSTQKVAQFSAEYAYDKVKMPVITMDVGFYIVAFNGFPGTYIKSFNDSFSPEKILSMFSDDESREAYFEDTMVVMINENEYRTFTKKIRGKIALEASEKNGWSIDRLFIPLGYSKPIGSMTTTEKLALWQDGSWGEVIDYLNDKVSL